MKKKEIRFINSEYLTLFTVKDGGKIKIISSHYGTENTYTVKIIDDYHFWLIRDEDGYTGHYHICNFAEIMEKAQNVYKKVEG